MIFQHTWKAILLGRKTQTRRVLPRHLKLTYDGKVFWNTRLQRVQPFRGKIIAVQPGRGRKAVGKIEVEWADVEKLQSISREDAIAEGFMAQWPWPGEGIERYGQPEWPIEQCEPTPRLAFKKLWDLINPKHPWDSDPTVIVMKFRLVDSMQAEPAER